MKQGFSATGNWQIPHDDKPTSRGLALQWMEDRAGQLDHRSYFVIFIFGNFRFITATTEACSGFPELLARASRA